MTLRPNSAGLNAQNSVYWTQDVLHRLEAKRRDLEAKLRAIDARIENQKDAHRRQIWLSLQSTVAEEREAAARIANWWNVNMESFSLPENDC